MSWRTPFRGPGRRHAVGVRNLGRVRLGREGTAGRSMATDSTRHVTMATSRKGNDRHCLGQAPKASTSKVASPCSRSRRHRAWHHNCCERACLIPERGTATAISVRRPRSSSASSCPQKQHRTGPACCCMSMFVIVTRSYSAAASIAHARHTLRPLRFEAVRRRAPAFAPSAFVTVCKRSASQLASGSVFATRCCSVAASVVGVVRRVRARAVGLAEDLRRCGSSCFGCRALGSTPAGHRREG